MKAQRQDKTQQGWVRLLPFWAILALALAHLTDPLGIARMSNMRMADLYQTFMPRPVASAGKTIHVDIDPESAQRLGPWPWPRTMLARLHDRLTGFGAQVVVFDFVLPGRDPTSPDQLIETMWNQPGAREAIGALSRLPDHDAQLARSLASGRAVTGFRPLAAARTETPPSSRAIVWEGDTNALRAPRSDSALVGNQALNMASAGIGNVAAPLSSDGVLRALPLVTAIGDRLFPHVVVEALRIGRAADEVRLLTTNGDTPRILGLEVGDLRIPTAADGSLYLYYGRPTDVPTYSAFDVLRDDFDGRQVNGAYVFLGASVDPGTDMAETPFGAKMPETRAKAFAVGQILSGHYLSRPDWALWAELALLIGVGFIIVAAVYRNVTFGGLVAAAAMLGTIYGGFQLFGDRGWLFDPTVPTATFAVAFAMSAAIAVVRNRRERDFVRTAFGNYLSPNVVSSLAHASDDLNFTGEVREATVMFCNIRGLEPVEQSFAKTPREVVNLVSDFLTVMTKTIHASGGTINRYIGDQIMAVWNAPLDDPDHANHACECALKMLEALDKLNDRLEDEARRRNVPFHTVHLGIGINTGFCVTGITGSKLRDDYSVIGKAVRVAGRLNHFSERYGPAIIIGEQTYMAVHHAYALLEIDQLKVHGQDQDDPMRVFALVGNPVMKANPKFRALEQAHEILFGAYREQAWDKALAIVHETRKMNGAMPSLYDIYERRILYHRFNPPPEDWTGGHLGP